MPSRNISQSFSALFLIAFGCLASLCSAGIAAEQQPKLVVVVSVDQLAYEYLQRFHAGFSDDGFFRRVEKEGASFTECLHRHAVTTTGPGHAVMLTGAYARSTGIPGNSWFDRQSGKSVYCVADPQAPLLGAKGKGASPRNLQAPAMGDVLKEKSSGAAKVFGAALKDRSAILMSGRKADQAFWFDSAAGRWVSSRYYGQQLPDYVAALNEKESASRYAGKSWKLLYSKDRYRLHRPDDYPFESDPYGLGRAFPHKIVAADKPNYAKQFTTTPMGIEWTLLLAQKIVSHERLGQREPTDLLTISLSTNDYVGHAYGPYSLEVEDITYRTDRQLGDFCRFLDRQIGAGRWTLALSADHGVAPIPEYAATINLPGKRNPLGDLKKLQNRLEIALREKLKPASSGQLIRRFEAGQIYLTHDTQLIPKKSRSAARKIARDFMLDQPAVAAAFTRDELLAASGKSQDLIDRFRRSFNAKRSGDVLFALAPYQVQVGIAATHGSPWKYDAHVPLLWLGAGIQPGVYATPTSPAAIAPTLASLLNVPAPALCVEQPLTEALRK